MRVERWSVVALCFTFVLAVSAPSAAQLPPPGLEAGDTYRVLFVTSTTTNGNIGGMFGADVLVNQAAQSSGSKVRDLSFKAVLSSATTDAVDRFADDGVPIYNTRGELVASTVSELFAGAGTTLDHQVWYDEFANQIAGGMLAWTGSQSDGTATTRLCQGWSTSSNAFDANVGHADLVDDNWLSWGTLNCTNPARLYGLSDPVSTGGLALFLPAAASAQGQSGTFWTTRAWIVNTAGATVTVRGALLRQGQSNSSAVLHPVTLGSIPAHGFLEIADLVSALSGSGLTAGVLLTAETSAQGQPLDLIRATSYTSTPDPERGGAYGQAIPAVAAGTLEKVWVPGLFQSSTHRTNLGVLNTSDEQITVHIEFFGLGGGALATPVDWTLQPYEQRQWGLPALGVASVTGGSARVSLLSGVGSFRAYTSTVDEVTGDAAYNAGQ